MRQPHKNGQTQSNNSSATGDELFECVLPFCGVALKGLKQRQRAYKSIELLIYEAIHLILLTPR